MEGNGMEREEKIRRQREFLTGVAYWGVWIAGAVFLLKLLGSVLFPFAIAFLVAVLLAKPVDFIAAKCRLKRGAAAVGCVLLLYAAVGVLCYLLGARIITLAYDSMLGAASFLTDTMLPALESIAERVETAFFGVDGEMAKLFGRETSGLLERAGKVLDGVNDGVMKKLSEAAMGIPGICLKVLFTVIATVFMELDYHTMMAFLARQFPDKKRKLIFDCKKNMLHMFGGFVFSYGIILTLTFAELFAGLLLLRVEGALVIAFVIAVLDILPVLGTGTVLVPWGVIAIIVGDIRMGAGILVLYVVITVIRNVVEPKLVGKQIGLSPIVTLPCMFVGLKFFGIPGMIGAPLAAALLKNLNDQGIIHIFQK